MADVLPPQGIDPVLQDAVTQALDYGFNGSNDLRFQLCTRAVDRRDIVGEAFESLDLRGHEVIVDIGCASHRTLASYVSLHHNRGLLYGVDLDPEPFYQRLNSLGHAIELTLEEMRAITDDVQALQAAERLAELYATYDSYERLKFIKSQLPELEMDGAKFPDDFAHVTMANFVLYHLAQPKTGIEEMMRITKPDGKVLITTSGKEHKAEHRQMEAEIAEELNRLVDLSPEELYKEVSTLDIRLSTEEKARGLTLEGKIKDIVTSIKEYKSQEDFEGFQSPQRYNARFTKEIGRLLIPQFFDKYDFREQVTDMEISDEDAWLDLVNSIDTMCYGYSPMPDRTLWRLARDKIMRRYYEQIKAGDSVRIKLDRAYWIGYKGADAS